jgi:tetratricopeptide (TPR) repeat protein
MPVNIISPKDTKILSGLPVFEWAGMPMVFYIVKVYDGNEMLWQKKGIQSKEIMYPQDAPSLAPDKQYAFEVSTYGHKAARVTFTIASVDESKAIRKELSNIEKEGTSYGRSTLAIMQAMLLIEKGYYYDARRILLDAISKDPSEPALYRLLGRLYEEQQVYWLAEEVYKEGELWGAAE